MMDHERMVPLERVARAAGWWIHGRARSGSRPEATAGQGSEDYDAVFERASRNLGQWLRRLARERRSAIGQLERLVSRPAKQQTFFLLNLDLRRGFCLAGLLLESALRQVYLDPRVAVHRARLALLVVDRLDLTEYGPSLVAEIGCRSWAVWGHTRRVLGRLGPAAEAFHEAHRILLHSGVEPLEEGLLLDFESSLWASRRQLGEAAEGLRRARACYREIKDHHLVGRAEVKEAVVALLDGRHTRAAGLLGAGLARLDAARDPYAAALGEALLAALRLESRRLDERLEAHRRLRRARSYLDLPPAVPVTPLVERVARRFEVAVDDPPLLSHWPRRL